MHTEYFQTCGNFLDIEHIRREMKKTLDAIWKDAYPSDYITYRPLNDIKTEYRVVIKGKGLPTLGNMNYIAGLIMKIFAFYSEKNMVKCDFLDSPDDLHDLVIEILKPKEHIVTLEENLGYAIFNKDFTQE